MLSAILIGNNIVNLSASSLSTMLATKMATQLGAGANAATFVGLATGILTILILIFGEITPKSAATINAEKMALGDVVIIYWLTRILTPVIFVINHLSYGVMRLIGINPNAQAKTMTENELLTVADDLDDRITVGHAQRIAVHGDLRALVVRRHAVSRRMDDGVLFCFVHS